MRRRSSRPGPRRCGSTHAWALAAARCRSASPRTSRARRRTPRRPATSPSTPCASTSSATTTATSTGCRRPRTGTLMVRHYVDNRRPNLDVVVDTEIAPLPTSASSTSAIEIAASLGVSSLLHRQPVAIWLDRDVVAGRTGPAGRNDLLDRLTLGRRRDRHRRRRRRARTPCAARPARRRSSSSPATCRPSCFRPSHRRPPRPRDRPRGRGPAGDRLPGALPGAKVIDVDTSTTSSAAWNAGGVVTSALRLPTNVS